MTTYSREIAYSFRREISVLATVVDGDDDAATRTLRQIEALLLEAGNQFRDRRYLSAVDAYQRARELLWGQLFPTHTLDEKLAIQVDLLRPLVSYAAEWLNVLPVETAVAGVRPREQVALPAAPDLGLRSARVGTVGAQAAADLQLASTLEAKGNASAAQFFRARAQQQAPELVRALENAVTAAPSPAPEPPPTGVGAGPTGPVGPIGRSGGPITSGPATRAGGVAGRLAGGTALEVREAPSVAADPGGARTLATTRISPVVAVRTDPISALALQESAAVVRIPDALTVEQRSYTARIGDATKTVAWSAGDAPAVNDLLAQIYAPRISLTVLPDVVLKPKRPADVAVGLAHAWYYETTLGLAECQHALGQWASAETWYLMAASYQFLNAAIEAPFVWGRLANLYLHWGDALFRDGDSQAALEVYSKVIQLDGTAPASQLYTLPGLQPAANDARSVLAKLDDPTSVSVSPILKAVILDVWCQVTKIAGGLDFWGHWALNIPIWTFDYLQSVAQSFAQLAVSSERDAMSFWEKADQGALTRAQLVQNVAQSVAERDAAQAQLAAANAELTAYQAGEATATLRAANARQNAQDYANLSPQWTMHQALSQQLQGGDDGNARQLDRFADRMTSGRGYSLEGSGATLAAAESLSSARLQAKYQIETMRREANELDAAAAQASAERKAAEARSKAAKANAHAAEVRVEGAQQLVAAFDDQRFTPDVWNALGERMAQLSRRYLMMALDVAKRMQRAYNFENDVAISIVKPDYSSDSIHGFLAADSLMADIQSFTYDLITTLAPKRQPIRQTISLAQRYGYRFESQFRATGRIEFETGLDDFDGAYPGTYGGRIRRVEVAVDGIVPPRGIRGTLTNAGISHYRVPSSIWQAGSGIKHRVQNREVQVISDFDPRADALMVDDDRRQRRVFEGAGVASSWALELPRDINELDYGSITDVRLTFTYEARFDPDLRDRVLADLATRPQLHERQRPVPLRWLFPDAFFGFADTGVLDITLPQGFFSVTERSPILQELGLVMATTPTTRRQSIVLAVTAPGKSPVVVTTGADGIVESSALAAVIGASALGDYRIALTAEANPSWVVDGRLDLDAIDNVALILGYAYTPRA